MKARELLNSPEVWCQEAPAQDQYGNRLRTFDPRAVKWCVLAAIQKTYEPWQWSKAIDQLLRALSVSEAGLAQMTKADKACCLMEWNDDAQTSFTEIRKMLCLTDI
jgi:hypothetical protein